LPITHIKGTPGPDQLYGDTSGDLISTSAASQIIKGQAAMIPYSVMLTPYYFFPMEAMIRSPAIPEMI